MLSVKVTWPTQLSSSHGAISAPLSKNNYLGMNWLYTVAWFLAIRPLSILGGIVILSILYSNILLCGADRRPSQPLSSYRPWRSCHQDRGQKLPEFLLLPKYTQRCFYCCCTDFPSHFSPDDLTSQGNLSIRDTDCSRSLGPIQKKKQEYFGALEL